MSECCSAGYSSWEHRSLNTNTIGKTKKTAKEFEKSETQARKRALLLLIAAYLRDCNLHCTADALATEAQLTLGSHELCDNVDLDIILQDYQTYYVARFGKAVRLLKNRKGGGGEEIAVGRDGGSVGVGRNVARKKPTFCGNQQISRKSSIQEGEVPLETSNDASALEISVTRLSKHEKINADQEIVSQAVVAVSAGDNIFNAGLNSCASLQRPLHEFEGYSPEWRELADQVLKEVVRPGLADGIRRISRVSWTDCIGVDECLQVLKEAVVYPIRYPEWFRSGASGNHGAGVTSPWKGVLLYGPPGTGKTLLAKAVANEAATTFINLTASTFVSKWRGESEKLLKVLFDIARFYAPTTIFIDELDSLAGKHEDSQHEASKRFTSELLIQLDGLLYEEDRVFVLATTNNPWCIHNAMLRRFEKRLHVPLPSPLARELLFRHYLSPLLTTAYSVPPATISPDGYRQMAGHTERYSGADIRLVCKEVAMQLVREAVKKGGKCGVRAIVMEDVERALEVVRRTCTEREERRYSEWRGQFV